MNTASIYKALTAKVTGCCTFFMLIAAAASAQERGKVEVIKDSRVDTLIARWDDLNKKSGAVRSSNWGYRVQIFSGSNRNTAFNAQNKFQEMYPGMRTYISYRDPNYKVHAGDFRSRLEAQKMMQELKPYFTGMFIISGKINPPKLETPK
ncbi:SPOR domain-containing protein [Mucilaginibacter limnophilus]|uniref:SPOR domain-containing protein n=1 Tax=Mucilaginibacter limnophilus TaxID=1932778 RepID=A0A437MUY6_9SPHI|nr:SPOR domain-containing protein [Mucilaginibacter limnophilus]RVU01474.1 SPOR domain-containing protein [Mucilaginibacter limnophilus]